jgi:hypothetical protein
MALSVRSLLCGLNDLTDFREVIATVVELNDREFFPTHIGDRLV